MTMMRTVFSGFDEYGCFVETGFDGFTFVLYDYKSLPNFNSSNPCWLTFTVNDP